MSIRHSASRMERWHLSVPVQGKGSCTKRGKCRPISLLSVPRKCFAHVLFSRMQPLLNTVIRSNQVSLGDEQWTLSLIAGFELNCTEHLTIRFTWHILTSKWLLTNIGFTMVPWGRGPHLGMGPYSWVVCVVRAAAVCPSAKGRACRGN